MWIDTYTIYTIYDVYYALTFLVQYTNRKYLSHIVYKIIFMLKNVNKYQCINCICMFMLHERNTTFENGDLVKMVHTLQIG